MQSVVMYNVPVDTPAQSPYHALAYGDGQSPWQDTVTAGNEIAITLGYLRKRDEVFVDDAIVTRTKGTVMYGRWFGSENQHRLETRAIPRIRQTGQTNPHGLMTALNDACVRKTPITWYPEFDTHPTEYVGVMAVKRLPARRISTLEQFRFSFHFAEIGTAQMPATIPPFV